MSSTPTNHLVGLSYATIAALWVLVQVVDIPYPVQLLTLVTCILYAACHKSLILMDDPDAPATDENGEPTKKIERETMKKEDAMQFPLMGSAALFSLYVAFKFFDPDMVNLIISLYFALAGCLAVTATFAPLFDTILPEKRVKKEIMVKHFLPEFIGGESPWDLSIDATGGELLALAGSLVFSGFYLKYKHWALNNVMGICFCLQGIERFSLGTYKIGAILLVGLFFYDIFWVFGTDVMVTVAKNLDGPIKILFPRSLVKNEAGKINLSLLGLGDIVIPGFFISLLLRFDAHRAKIGPFPTARFPKPYFYSCLLFYVLGLATTIFIMIYFEAAQPALLYLVPACLGSSIGCALWRGELKELMAYSEEEEEEEPEGGEKTKDEKKKD